MVKRLLCLGWLAAWMAASAATQPLVAAVGDYVEGELDSGPHPVDVDLVDGQGRPVRRLLSASTGKGSFRFVVARDLPPDLALEVKAPHRLHATVRTVPLSAQKASAERPRSPAVAALAARLEAIGHAGQGARRGTPGDDTETFWQQVAARGAPLAEPLDNGRWLLTFLWRGAERNVRLVGGPSNDHEWLTRLGSSDVWFRTFEVPGDTRLAYQMAPDVPDLPGSERERRIALLATAQVDPLNHHPWPAHAVDRHAGQSTVSLPGAPVQPGLTNLAAPALRGTLQQFNLRSPRLGNERRITVYRPPGFNAAHPDTVLLFAFDADEYLDKVPTPALLDNLQASGRLPPVVAVFVANPDRDTRSRELPANPHFADFMAHELLPEVLARTGLPARPHRTVLAGSSYGGLAAATVALRHPSHFGNVLSMSGSFWWSAPDAPADQPHHVANLVLAAPHPAGHVPFPRFFLSAGLFERARAGSDGILETNRHLRDVLKAKGHAVTHREYAGGHDYFVWRGALADGLLNLFGDPEK